MPLSMNTGNKHGLIFVLKMLCMPLSSVSQPISRAAVNQLAKPEEVVSGTKELRLFSSRVETPSWQFLPFFPLCQCPLVHPMLATCMKLTWEGIHPTHIILQMEVGTSHLGSELLHSLAAS